MDVLSLPVVLDVNDLAPIAVLLLAVVKAPALIPQKVLPEKSIFPDGSPPTFIINGFESMVPRKLVLSVFMLPCNDQEADARAGSMFLQNEEPSVPLLP